MKGKHYNSAEQNKKELSVMWYFYFQTKYCLLDKDDLELVENFHIEGRVDIDPNGHGAAIQAWCFDLNKGRNSGQYLHDVLWWV